MIHVGSVYEVLKWDYLGGSYGCFGFIPKNDIYATPEDAEQAVVMMTMMMKPQWALDENCG
ncbi:hypothetical protein P4S72_15870 [Vibrio sp. PP-XX7]